MDLYDCSVGGPSMDLYGYSVGGPSMDLYGNSVGGLSIDLYGYSVGGPSMDLYGGVGFFPLARIFGKCSTIYFPPVLYLFFFGGGEGGDYLMHLIPLFIPGSVHSGSASRHVCGRMFPNKLRGNWFSNRFPSYAWT